MLESTTGGSEPEQGFVFSHILKTGSRKVCKKKRDESRRHLALTSPTQARVLRSLAGRERNDDARSGRRIIGLSAKAWKIFFRMRAPF